MDKPPVAGSQIVPSIIYGTAFKDDDTADLVQHALRHGFRAIDTSGNKPQYREKLVGDGIHASMDFGVTNRRELYIQTKFSPYKAGKDPALYPYDINKSIPEQVLQSVASSFVNLGVHYVDCLILHSLYPDMADTLKAWRAMEALVPSKALSLGLSNVDAESLQQIYEAARIKPNSVQNRFTGETAPRPDTDLPPGLPYPAVPYDRDVRKLCDKYDITYVPWGLLWGNAPIMDDDPMLGETAKKLGVSKQVAWYACMEDLAGCRTSILCGTTKEETMENTLNDLDKLDGLLNEDEDHMQAYAICLEHIRPIVNGPRAERTKAS